MKTDVGILIALPWELKSITEIELNTGECENLTPGVRVCLTGIGSKFVRSACESFIDGGARLLISWGTAAALEADVKAGTLLLPGKVIADERPTIQTEDHIAEYVKGLLPATIKYSDRPLFTSTRLVETPQQKLDIGQRTEALAVDMESWFIANAAKENGVDFLIVRAVSDTVTMTIPSAITKSISKNGNIALRALLIHLIRNPNELVPLLKLYIGFHQAKKSLTDVAGYLLPALSNSNINFPYR